MRTVQGRRVAVLAAAAMLVTACQQEAAEAPAEGEGAAATTTSSNRLPSPPFSVNRQMVSLIDNESHVLWGAEQQGGAPQSEADWNTLEDHALQIVAAGYLLAQGGSGPEDAQWVAQPEWQTDTRSMIDAAMAAATAAESKNMDALLAANGQLVDSCLSCHERFKPELPTEGRTHQHGEEPMT